MSKHFEQSKIFLPLKTSLVIPTEDG